MISSDELRRLIDEQLRDACNDEIRAVMRGFLVEPWCEMRPWDYEPPDQSYPCWVVWVHGRTGCVIVQCEQGFGPAYPWGVLDRDPASGLSSDGAWFRSFEDAVRQTAAWEGEDPPGYEVG